MTAALSLLALAAAAAAQSRLWRAASLDARDFLPGLARNAPDTAQVRTPEHPGTVSLAAGSDWDGLLRREDADGGRSELLSASAAQTLWVRPLPGAALGLTWGAVRARNRRVDPGRLDASLGEERAALGAAWTYSLLSPGPRAAGAPYLDLGALLPDRRRQDFAWMLAGGREGLWRAEYGMSQEEAVEEARAENLDSAGGGEVVLGQWRSRVLTHRLVVKAPAFGGAASALLAYGAGRPRRPEREFWLTDSSRALRGRLAYARARGVPAALGAWEAWGDFREAEAITLGRRIPPGSEGLKRFHYARNHAVLWEIGTQAGPALPAARGAAHPGGRGDAGPGEGWRAALRYRALAFASDPAADALDARSETLSYNRLGLSFIANLYGGLYKLSEVISARGDAGLLEAEGEWGARLGPLRGSAGLSLHRTGFELDAVGLTLSQRLIVVDTAEAFREGWSGYLLGATPRLRLALDLPAAGIRSGRGPSAWIEAEAAQSLPLHLEVRPDGDGGGGAGEGGEADHPAFRNGFEARLRLVAGF